jgi:hypothetical protein
MFGILAGGEKARRFPLRTLFATAARNRRYGRDADALAGPPADRLPAGGDSVTSLDGLWYLAEEARRRAERSYHRTVDAHGEGHIERTLQKRVSRGRFRTLARRIRD